MAHLDPGPGLAELVLGHASQTEAFYPTSLPNLTLIPAGEMPVVERSRNARSAALVNTINEFSQNFDMLLLDIPPILVIRDSPVIAGLSDCLCLVIRQGLTPIPIVKTALDEIEHLCIRGVVMNGLKLNIPKAFQGNK
jgi:Mrp family chromosome partitioning ATPase